MAAIFVLIKASPAVRPSGHLAPLEARLHLREHFAVNVAVAGGLLLLQDLGGGRYTVDALLKKAS